MQKVEVDHWADFNPSDYTPKVENGVILEIGPGVVSAPTVSEEVFERLKNDELYIGIDYFAGQLPKHPKFGEYVAGDLIDLPIRSNSADQIWLMNVFGEGDHKWRSVDYDEWELRDRFLHELSRVLKPDGTVIIGEYNTPAVWLLDKDLKKFGFKKEVFLKEKVWEFIEKYRITNEWVIRCFGQLQMGAEPFFIALKKPLNDLDSKSKLK